MDFFASKSYLLKVLKRSEKITGFKSHFGFTGKKVRFHVRFGRFAMGRILLIRHGESEGNIDKRAETTPAQIPLTEKGREQARQVALKVDFKPDLIITSPYIRTQQTAEPMIQMYPDVPVEIWEVQEFTFLDAGKCKGTTIADRRPMVNAYFQRADPDYHHALGCDSFNDFVNRSVAFLKKIETCKDKNVVVFTHSQFIILTRYLHENGDTSGRRELMCHFVDILRHDKVDNCGIVELQF